jgi:transglutaminase-like putative cysteine protease
VSSGILDFLIMPEVNEEQELLDYKIQVTPKLHHKIGVNHLGFKTIRLFITAPINQLSISFTSKVIKKTKQLETETAANEEDFNFYIDNYFYKQQTPLTNIPQDAPILNFKNTSDKLLPFIIEISNQIHAEIKYEQFVTNVLTSAADVLQIKAGVCQDFSHVLLGVFRAHQIMARYVSGYLHTYHDEAQQHAWVEAYVPGCGWVGIDAANNCLVNENYIKIAHGADYNECAAIRGTIESSGLHTTNYAVKVALMEQQITQTQAQ